MTQSTTCIVTRSTVWLPDTATFRALPGPRDLRGLWRAPGDWVALMDCAYIGEKWPAGKPDPAGLQRFANDLSKEIEAPVAAGWLEGGDVFAGCLSGKGRPLLFALDMFEEQFGYAWEPAYFRRLQQRWGTPWIERAAPAVAGWLGSLGSEVSQRDVAKILGGAGYSDDDWSLLALFELTGLHWHHDDEYFGFQTWLPSDG